MKAADPMDLPRKVLMSAHSQQPAMPVVSDPAQFDRKSGSRLEQLVFNNRLDAGLTIFFMVVVVVLAFFSIKTALAALKEDKPTAKETPYEPMPENLDAIETQAKGAH